MGIVHQEQEYVAIGRIEGRPILGRFHKGIVPTGTPIPHTRPLPAGIVRAVAGDIHDGGHELVVVDTAVFGSGHRTQFEAAGIGFQRFDLLRAMAGQAILQVDARKCRRQLAQIAGGSADQARKLAEAPMRRRYRLGPPRQDQRQPLGIIAARLHPYRPAFHGPRSGALRSSVNRRIQIR
jgi:hypothetical protein